MECPAHVQSWLVRPRVDRARNREGSGLLEIAETATPARRLVFLGSGTSSGVPVLGCDCAVCTSGDPRNSRMRPSVLFKFPRGNLLIDTTPEMRIQLLREKVHCVH